MRSPTSFSSTVLMLAVFLQQLAVVLGARYRIAYAATGEMVVPKNGANPKDIYLGVRPASANDGQTEAWDTDKAAGETVVKFQSVKSGQFVFSRFPQMDVIMAAKYATPWLITRGVGDKVTIQHKASSNYWTLRNGYILLAPKSGKADQEWRMTAV